MRIWINGAAVELADGMSLYEYLARDFSPPDTTYVLNGKDFIPKEEYRAYQMRDGERLTVYRVPSGG